MHPQEDIHMSRKITVDVASIIAKKFPTPVIRELRFETDKLCERCEGAGVARNMLGTIMICPDCNGIGLDNSICPKCKKHPKSRGQAFCEECYKAQIVELNEARFNKARKIHLSNYTGMCNAPNSDSICDVEDFILFWREEAENGNLPPKWMFSMIELDILKDLNITDKVITLCDDEGYEDMTDMLDMKGLRTVQEAYDAWAAEQGQNGKVYVEDYGCVVLLDELHDLIRKDAAGRKGK